MTQLYSIEQELYELSQGNENISEFFTKLKILWVVVGDVNRLPQCVCHKCTCGLEQKINQMQDNQKMIQFMMKLNDDFSAVRDRRRFTDSKNPKFNSETQFTALSNVVPGNSKPAGNWTKNPGSQYFYTHCKIVGHSYDRCFKVHGYPPNFRFKDKRVAVVTQSEDNE
ncbi:uncharacterized protein LOC141674515 [Apium graveolens]|uniref:uncharacterized protein LOC141674515 n=1 Tax=Apium graveolens TaxID=4045 RepID=UPI003D7B54B4